MSESRTAALFRTAGPLSWLQRSALGLAELTGVPRYAAAFALGTLAAVALPPFDLAPVLIIAFAGLIWLADGSRDGRAAFALGWWFGSGFFVAGLYWLGAALLVDAARFWWLLPFAVLGVPAGLALFTAAALWAHHQICRWLSLGGSARILTLVAFWAIAEWLRGHVLSGFPWNLLGYVWAGGFPGGLAMLQVSSVIGIYGLSLLTVLAAALPARLGDLAGRRRVPVLVAALLIALIAAFGSLRLAGDQRAMQPGITLRLVQPSIPQSLVNDNAAAVANFRRLLALTQSPAAQTPTAIIWPEGSAPPFLSREPAARRAIGAALPPKAIALVGTVRTDPPPHKPVQLWNGLDAIDASGEIVASYDKAHLVPFGEYVPLRGILPISKITPGTVDFSAGPGPRTLTIPGLPPVGPLICYEAIFPGDVVDELHRPAWLLNITNDAWYGFTSGPFQHFAIARVRTVEEGLPLVRDANNGISAVFDPYGRVVARLDLDTIGALDVPLPAPLSPTLYSRWKDAPFYVLVLALLALAAGMSPRRRANRPDGAA
jgi:apolipoprotein N-acyltransferase